MCAIPIENGQMGYVAVVHMVCQLSVFKYISRLVRIRDFDFSIKQTNFEF